MTTKPPPPPPPPPPPAAPATEREAGRVKASVKKRGKKRVLTLPAPAIKALLPFREVGNGYVFPSLRKPGIAYDFKKPWSEALKSAQIDDFTFHDLRHTHASYLAQNGATLLEIAEALGHSQIQVTMRYAHLCIDSKQKLNDRVFGSM